MSALTAKPPGLASPAATGDTLASAYLFVKERVVQAGFLSEIHWQSQRNPRDIDEESFLREAAWVVLSGGMSTRVVEKVFPAVSGAFRGFRSAREVCEHRLQIASDALRYFNHPRKIQGIVSIAEVLEEQGLAAILDRTFEQGPGYLASLPFIGPITSRHLAKNLGFATAKADRHLQRLSETSGFASTDEFCCAIARVTGENLSVVDVVLWRACASGLL